jgi:GntR family transcriptional regulator, histidine utilization repressor
LTLFDSWGWEALREMFRARITERDWPPCGLIPNEAQLAADLGVGRATVNRALQALAEEGLLERRKRAGTRVAALPARRARLEIPVIRLEVEALGAAYAFVVTRDEMAALPGDIALRMGLTAGQTLRHLITLHFADDSPHALEYRWLNMAALPGVPDFAGLSVNEWLVANVAFQGGDLAFLAAPAGQAEAQALKVPAGAALMVTERVTFGLAGAITHVRLWHRPGYRVETTL